MAKLTLSDLSGGYLSPALVNANNTLIEAALENTLSRDGTSPNAMGANLDMNSFRIVNLAAPASASDAVRFQDLDGAAAFLATTGSNLIGFIQAGVGAIAETVQTALRRFKFAVQYGTFAQAVTACDGGTLIIDTVVNVPANITVPSTVTLDFKRGGMLTIPDGVTVRIYSQPIAGRHQIFDIVGTDANPANWGDVAFNDSDSSPTTPYGTTIRVMPEWFGAQQATSTTGPDSTTAMRKCFRSYKPVTGSIGQAKVVVDWLGAYVISDPIYMHRLYDIEGHGTSRSLLVLNCTAGVKHAIEVGGYLLNGTTPTAETNWFPAPSITGVWFRGYSAGGVNQFSSGSRHIGLVEEVGQDNVLFSLTIRDCWFDQIKLAVEFKRQVGDSVIENCYFDSTCYDCIKLEWTNTGVRPISGGLTVSKCSFLPANGSAISLNYWTHLIVDSCKFFFGTQAYVKGIRWDGLCGTIQVSNSLFYTYGSRMGDEQDAFYCSSTVEDLQVTNCSFENISSVLFKDNTNAVVRGTIANCRMENISRTSIIDANGAHGVASLLKVTNNSWGTVNQIAISLQSRAEIVGNTFRTTTITPPGTGAPTGGTFTLTFSGQTTGAINYNAVAADVQTALEALSNIAPGDVTVTGSAGNFEVEFGGVYAGTLTSMMTYANSLTPSSGIRITKSLITTGGVNDIQRIEYAQIPTVGTELAYIVLRGGGGNTGASRSRCQDNYSGTSGWLTASYRQSSLGTPDLTDLVSSNNRGLFNNSTYGSLDQFGVYCEATKSRLSDEAVHIEAWDNWFDNVTTKLVRTTNATPTSLFAANLYHENSHVFLTAMVCGKGNADPSVENALYRVDAVFKLEAGASTLLNNTTTTIYESTAGMDAAIVDGATTAVDLTVTGVAATTIDWSAKINTVLL